MTGWFDSQALQAAELRPPFKGSLLRGGGDGSVLQVAPNCQPHIMQKHFIIHRMSGVTKWIHSGSSSLGCQGTLCHQHRWSMALEKSLLRAANNESTEHRPSLANDSLGNHKKERVPVVLSNEMYRQDSGQVIWKTCRLQRPDSDLLWKAMERGIYLWTTLSCLHCFLIRNRDMDNLSRCKRPASAGNTAYPRKQFKRRVYS